MVPPVFMRPVDVAPAVSWRSCLKRKAQKLTEAVDCGALVCQASLKRSKTRLAGALCMWLPSWGVGMR